jgi:nitrite reductase/ring-hydroxylating ferredoxin subunit
VSDAWVDVGTVEDMQPDTLRLVNVEGVALILVRVKDGLHALGAACTHEQADLADGDLDATSITCPLHFSRFALEDGTPLDPPADEALSVHSVRVRDGRILIRTRPS